MKRSQWPASRQPGPVVNQPLNLPVYQSSAWEFASLRQAERIVAGEVPGVEYGTRRVPNVLELEKRTAELHGAEDAVATCGGMAALLVVLQALLRPGARVVASHDLFGATVELLERLKGWNVEVQYVDTADATRRADALASGCDLLLTETLSNPCLRVADLATLAHAARAAGGRLVVDNTFATPFHCRPLTLGADLVVESLTKALNGHNDVVLGAVVGTSEALAPIRRFVDLTGLAPAPVVAAQGVRGMSTFELRQSRAASNASRVAHWLAARPELRAVHYPGLTRHAEHLIAVRQLRQGFGALVAVDLGRPREAVEAFLGGLERFRLAMTLGGSSSLITHPWTMTHRWLEPQQRLQMGITEGLLRLSLGIEDPDQLTDDLQRGLARLPERADQV